MIPADAYVVVSGEYNHSVPPALANLLDHFLEEYFRKPSAIVSYSAGSFGGVRAAVVLRSMLAEMGMSSIPSTLPIPTVQSAFDDAGAPTDPRFQQTRRPLLRRARVVRHRAAGRPWPCLRAAASRIPPSSS